MMCEEGLRQPTIFTIFFLAGRNFKVPPPPPPPPKCDICNRNHKRKNNKSHWIYNNFSAAFISPTWSPTLQLPYFGLKAIPPLRKTLKMILFCFLVPNFCRSFSALLLATPKCPLGQERWYINLENKSFFF